MQEKKKILIVDDEPNVLRTLELRLVDAGYAVVKANCGREALSMAAEEKPDLIILDMMMPDLSGARVSEELKNNDCTKDIPVIFLTSLYVRESEVSASHAAGETVFIAKPYEPEVLLDEIKKQISD